MAVVISAGVGASMSAATGRPSQNHLIFAANQGAWWAFYLTSTQALSAKYSADFSTWTAPTGSPFTLANAHGSEGRNFGVGYANLAATDVAHLIVHYNITSTSHKPYNTRFTLGTTWTATNAEAAMANSSQGADTAPINQSGCAIALSTAGVPFCSDPLYDTGGGGLGNIQAAKATNTDAGSSWTNGWPDETSVQSVATVSSSAALWPLAGGNMLLLGDNGSTNGNFTNIYGAKYTTSWAAAATILAATVTSTDTNSWGSCALSTGDIHVVALANNASTFVHRRYNGTSWANGNTPPTLTLATKSGIALASDGTSVWAFAIDSSKNIKYSQWVSGTGWGAWTVLEATRTNTSSYITATYSAAANAIGVMWTEANGANFDVVGSILSLSAPPTVTFPWTVDIGVRLPRQTPVVMVPSS